MLAHARVAVVCASAFLVPHVAWAQDFPAAKQTRLGKYLSAVDAARVVKAERAQVLFVDVRSRAELQFVGYTPEIDGAVPFLEMSQFGEWDDSNSRYKLDANPTFSEAVGRLLTAKGLSKAAKVILICRSGDRSARAADILQEAGYANVYSIIDGFEGDLSPDGRRAVNGWKNAGLPWTYRMQKEKVFVSPF